MAGGTSKAIAQVKVGDAVANSVPGAKGTEAHKVSAVIVTHTDHDFVDVTVRGGGLKSVAKVAAKTVSKARSLAGKAGRRAALGLAAGATAALALTATPAAASPTHDHQLTTTFHHPFYDETQSAFVEAKDLHSGDVLQTPTGTATVTGVRLYHANTTTTYDLTIGTLHTYYVQAGTTPVLVHNCGNEELQGVANDMAARATAYQAKSGSDYAVRNETTAVVRGRFPVGDGTWKEANVVAHSGEGVSLEQIGMANQLGDIPVETNFEGFTHAEHNALKMIDQLGGVPIAGDASRSVCTEICAPFIRATGGRISGYAHQLERGTKVRTFYWPGSRR